MSQDRLGSITRALVGINPDYHRTILDIVNRFNSTDASRWNDVFIERLQEGLSEFQPPAPPPPLLVFDQARFASVDLSQPHDPQAFWHDTDETPARRVWGSFPAIIAKAKRSGESDIVKIPYDDLSRGTTVRDILAAPGVGNYDPSRLSKIIASMITAQPNGEFSKDGLLNDGKANLFPCGSLLVYVYWYGLYRYWYVSDWRPVSGVRAARRVFSGNLIQ